jgi:hypothetical protein
MLEIKSLSIMLLFVVIFCASLFLLSWLIHDILYRIAAKRAGCSAPIKYLHWEPFLGLDLFLQRLSDMKAGDSIATDRNLLKKYGKTVQTNAWGVKQYVISDPLNI